MDASVPPAERGSLAAIQQVVAKDPSLSSAIQLFPQGVTLFKEGENPRKLLLILEGKVALRKTTAAGDNIAVDHLEGQLLGIVSYISREPVYVTAVAVSPVRALVLTWEQFEHLRDSHPELYHHLYHVTEKNLVLRYRGVVKLHLEIAAINRNLERERAELRDALAELRQTRNRLIHQEKLATLGQLTAGLAHELNNPIGALTRSVEYLRENIGEVIRGREGEPGAAGRLWESGLNSPIPDSQERRKRMETIAARFPHLPRAVTRRLSIMPEEALEPMFSTFNGPGAPSEQEALAFLLHFEAGYYLRSIGLSADRIGRLVVSLRNYSRGKGETVEQVDVRAGVRDTLFIVGNRIKDVDTELRLEETPPVLGNSGELNQVWTNLIVNACDAMGDKGRLVIACGREDPGSVHVTVTDSGPGLSPEFKDKIFEPNFTTKTSATHFGLGLGLAISREIIHKHGGELTAENSREGGAVFKAVLPVMA